MGKTQSEISNCACSPEEETVSKITKNFYMRYIYVAFTAIYVFICVQKRATKEGYKGKSEREEVQGVAEALWFVQPGAEEAEGRPHSSLHIDLYTYFVYTNMCVCVCVLKVFFSNLVKENPTLR